LRLRVERVRGERASAAPGGECQLASESQLRIVPLPNAITGLRANELHAANPYAHDAGKKGYLLE